MRSKFKSKLDLSKELARWSRRYNIKIVRDKGVVTFHYRYPYGIATFDALHRGKYLLYIRDDSALYYKTKTDKYSYPTKEKLKEGIRRQLRKRGG